MKTVQYFSRDYLERCRAMKPEQILRFLEEFRLLHGAARPSKSRLISIKVPEPLLAAFKTKAQLSGTPYQTEIKRLMKAWVEASDPTND